MPVRLGLAARDRGQKRTQARLPQLRLVRAQGGNYPLSRVHDKYHSTRGQGLPGTPCETGASEIQGRLVPLLASTTHCRVRLVPGIGLPVPGENKKVLLSDRVMA